MALLTETEPETEQHDELFHTHLFSKCCDIWTIQVQYCTCIRKIRPDFFSREKAPPAWKCCYTLLLPRVYGIAGQHSIGVRALKTGDRGHRHVHHSGLPIGESRLYARSGVRLAAFVEGRTPRILRLTTHLVVSQAYQLNMTAF